MIPVTFLIEEVITGVILINNNYIIVCVYNNTYTDNQTDASKLCDCKSIVKKQGTCLQMHSDIFFILQEKAHLQ